MKLSILVFVLTAAQIISANAEDKPVAKDPQPAQEKPKAVQEKPAQEVKPVPTEVKPLEEVLATEKDPNGKHVMVSTRILVIDPNVKGAMHVQFVDVKPSPNVNIKKWDAKLSELKPNTLLAVTGELHFGAVRGGTPSIRYKVREVSGKKYNDHRHWRTDQAIYIINPTYVIEAANAVKPAE